MIIPSIDIMDGHAVQLVGGKEKKIDAGVPQPIMEKFRLAGEVACIDLDAALGNGNNTELIRELASMGKVRVGGGIRDVPTALEWLNAGADKIILGTAAKPEVLKHLPPERVIAALDAVDGEVVVEGWQTRTGESILDRMAELSGYVGGFMVTFVEREGRLEGTNLDMVEELLEAAGDAHLTVAGGITTVEEVKALHELGVDAQVGMAIYTDEMHLADGIFAPLTSDRPDGLYPTVVCDEYGQALGLAYSSDESLRVAVDRQRGAYQSRSRGLWVKGETSGATQELLRVDLDCDADAIRFTVRQGGDGFCHLDTWTCWGDDDGLTRLEKTLKSRLEHAPDGSYTRKLFENPQLLDEKIEEEAAEFIEADSRQNVAWEAADVVYFVLAKAMKHGVSLRDIEDELDRRALKATRRDGSKKFEE
ncbi:MAG: phosphoribosyl-ATP diphosphatase [Myxococcota bacterium]